MALPVSMGASENARFEAVIISDTAAPTALGNVASEFRLAGDGCPTGINKFAPCRLERIGGPDGTIHENCALLVSDLVRRGENLVEEPSRLGEETLDDVGVHMLETGQRGDGLDVDDRVEHEGDVTGGC